MELGLAIGIPQLFSPRIVQGSVWTLHGPSLGRLWTHPDEYILFVSSNLSLSDELKGQLFIKVEQQWGETWLSHGLELEHFEVGGCWVRVKLVLSSCCCFQSHEEEKGRR